MGRPCGTKNKMRAPEEKEQIVLEYLNGNIGQQRLANSYGIERRILQNWIYSYQEKGIEGLKRKSPKGTKPGKYNRHPSEVEKLKQELLKKEVEIERLKKDYQAKGVGAKKVYDTTFDVNTK